MLVRHWPSTASTYLYNSHPSIYIIPTPWHHANPPRSASWPDLLVQLLLPRRRPSAPLPLLPPTPITPLPPPPPLLLCPPLLQPPGGIAKSPDLSPLLMQLMWLPMESILILIPPPQPLLPLPPPALPPLPPPPPSLPLLL